jgi:hypothetical protein
MAAGSISIFLCRTRRGRPLAPRSSSCRSPGAMGRSWGARGTPFGLLHFHFTPRGVTLGNGWLALQAGMVAGMVPSDSLATGMRAQREDVEAALITRSIWVEGGWGAASIAQSRQHKQFESSPSGVAPPQHHHRRAVLPRPTPLQPDTAHFCRRWEEALESSNGGRNKPTCAQATTC